MKTGALWVVLLAAATAVADAPAPSLTDAQRYSQDLQNANVLAGAMGDLIRRTRGVADDPALTGADRKARLQALSEERRRLWTVVEYYRAVTDHDRGLQHLHSETAILHSLQASQASPDVIAAQQQKIDALPPVPPLPDGLPPPLPPAFAGSTAPSPS